MRRGKTTDATRTKQARVKAITRWTQRKLKGATRG